MRAPLSIVIPTLDAEQELPATLHFLMEGISAGLVCELLISDGGSKDATLTIADAVGAVVVSGSAGRGGQLRRGAEAAIGEWLLFLHADTHLGAGWSDIVAEHIRQSDRVACFRLRFRAHGAAPRLVAGWANFRSWMGLPYGDQGLLIRRSVYDRAGGYPDIPIMEDVALARALRGRIEILDVEANTSAERYLQDGWLRRGAKNLWTLAGYFWGVPPDNLAKRYLGRD